MVRSFEKMFILQLQTPLDNFGEIQNDEVTTKYIVEKDAAKNIIIDLLIFDNKGFPPLHKKINTKGEIQDLENFQISIMYESQEDRAGQEIRMKEINKWTAKIIIDKGLAVKSECWIQKYL